MILDLFSDLSVPRISKRYVKVECMVGSKAQAVNSMKYSHHRLRVYEEWSVEMLECVRSDGSSYKDAKNTCHICRRSPGSPTPFVVLICSRTFARLRRQLYHWVTRIVDSTDSKLKLRVTKQKP